MMESVRPRSTLQKEKSSLSTFQFLLVRTAMLSQDAPTARMNLTPTARMNLAGSTYMAGYSVVELGGTLSMGLDVAQNFNGDCHVDADDSERRLWERICC